MSQLRGYVTDVPYVRSFKPMLAPAWLDHVAMVSGYEPPAREDGFAWCDLGCGQGVTAAILAATHPTGRFYGIDAMPAHIDHARRLAAEASAGNVQFLICDFDEAADLALPRFDYIVAHGVYSWVDQPVRAALRRFIDRRLRPGGLAYISYNAMPGWLADLPFQYLVRELGEGAAGDSADRFAIAEAMIRRLAELRVPGFASSYIVRELAERPEDYAAGYLVHEFMHRGWAALYVTDVRRDLATIGLVPAGSATLVENFDPWVLGREARPVLADIVDDNRRELVRDFFLHQRFRCDVFTRHASRMPAAKQRQRLLGACYALTRPPGTVSYRMTTPAGHIVFDNPAARAAVQALAAGPRPLAGLAREELPAADLLANALALCAAGDVRPVEPTCVSVEPLNHALQRRLGSREEIAALALPCGTALDIDHTLRGLFGSADTAAIDAPAEWRAFLAANAADAGRQASPSEQKLAPSKPLRNGRRFQRR